MRRARAQPSGYPSDLTDAQWQVIAPHLPPQVPGRRGRPRVWPLRQIIDAILYVDQAGCPWRYLPADFPPSVQDRDAARPLLRNLHRTAASA